MTETGAKKGLSPLAWIAIGCAGLLVVGVVVAGIGGYLLARKAKEVVENVAEDFSENPARAAAQMVVKLNPELEMVDEDEDGGTMTVRNTRTGEEITFDYAEIAEGRFGWETDEGRVEIDANDAEQGIKVTTDEGETHFGAGASSRIPDWVPRYPGVETQGAFSTSGPDGDAGAATFETGDDVTTVLDHFSEVLEGDGYEVTRQAVSTGGAEREGVITGVNEANGRTVTVTANAASDDGDTTVAVHYSGKS